MDELMCMDGCIDGRTDGVMDGRTDEWMEGLVDGWMGGRTILSDRGGLL